MYPKVEGLIFQRNQTKQTNMLVIANYKGSFSNLTNQMLIDSGGPDHMVFEIGPKIAGLKSAKLELIQLTFLAQWD